MELKRSLLELRIGALVFLELVSQREWDSHWYVSPGYRSRAKDPGEGRKKFRMSGFPGAQEAKGQGGGSPT